MDPDGTALDLTAGMLGGLAGQLRDAVSQVRGLVAAVAEDWPDPRGQAWVDRAELVHRDLDRQADEAVRLARVVERLAREVIEAAVPGPGGPVLPGVEAVRVVPGQGMRVATLPDPPR